MLYGYGDLVGRPRTNKFSLMSEEEILQYLWARYQKYGIGSLSYVSIKNEKGLYFHLYKKGLKITEIINKLDLNEEYHAFKTENFTKTVNGNIQRRWSWKRIIKEAAPIVEDNGFLPPAQWFQANKLGSLVFSVYKLGNDWNNLRAHFNSYENSDFIQSRNGLRWRSHPEASLSNFLYTRGIKHKNGEKYPDEYSDYGDASYGYYDLHFKSDANEWIDVEVWGDKPKGHNEQGYQKVRTAKERFNKKNKNFLGMHYSDCFEEEKLETLLNKYIGYISPYIFEKPTDKVIQSTHWSNADELIEHCKEIAKSQPGGIFPTEEWLRKRGKWKDRKGQPYNTVSIYIKTWIGGVRKLREILNQDQHSTVSWTKEKAVEEYRGFFKKYGITPGQARTSNRNISKDDVKRANNISIAVAKYVGSVEEVNKILKIEPSRKTKWNKDIILQEISRIFDKYSLGPTQISNLSKSDKKLFSIDKNDIIISKQLVDRVGSYFSGIKEVYAVLDIKIVDIRKLRKRRITNHCS